MSDPKVHLNTLHPQLIEPSNPLSEKRRTIAAKLAGMSAMSPWCWKCNEPVRHILLDHMGDANRIEDGRLVWRARHHGEWTTIELEKASSQIQNQRVASHLKRLYLFAPETYYGAVGATWTK